METKNVLTKSQTYIYIAVILGVIAVVNYLATKYFVRADLTENKEYSISAPTKNMLRDLDDVINIKVYFSKNLPPKMATLQAGVKDLLTEFKAYGGKNLIISYVDPGENKEEKDKLRTMGIPEVQLQTFEKDKAQAIMCYMGMAIFFGDKKEVIPVVQDLQNLEYDLAQRVMKVARNEAPKVGILKLDSLPKMPPQYQQNQPPSEETTEGKYKPLIDALKENYQVETVDIAEGQKIDPSIKTLIIPGGDDRSFTSRDLFEIDQYFMNGGNLVVLADAVKISFAYGAFATPQSPQIHNLLEHYGVRVEKELICDASCGKVQIPQNFGGFQMHVAIDYPYFVRIGQDGFDKKTPAVSGLGDVLLPWASPLSILVDTTTAADSSGVKATVLASSSPKSWRVAGQYDINPQQEWGKIFAEKKSELKASVLAAHLEGAFKSYFAGKSVPPVHEPAGADSALSQIKLATSGDDQNREIVPANRGGHLVVFGDADFVASRNAAPTNLAMMQNVVDWLSSSENLIAIRSRTLTDRTINNDQLAQGSALPNIIRMLNILGMPLLLIIVGLLIFYRRRAAVAEGVKVTSENREEKAS